jgi:RND family efflux transporter MFP subunit
LENILNRKLIIVLVVMAVAVGGGVFFVNAKKSAKAPVVSQVQPSLTVTTESPDSRSWPQRVTATGNVQAWQEAIIGSEVAGLRLAELYVNVGDAVKKGQLLAKFTDEITSLDLDQQQAAVDEARARFVQAEAKAESSQKLRDAGMISNLDNIQNKSNAQIAQAQLKAAEARVKAQKLRLAYTQVRAPDGGIISSRTATVGSVLQTGSEMFRYIRRNQLEWRAEIPEEPLLKIREGQKVSLRTNYGEVVAGKVSRVSPVVDAQSRNGSVYIELTGTKNLKAGMFAQGELELGRNTAITVAQSAVVVRDGYSYVFSVGAEGRVSQLKVAVGRRMEGRIELLDGNVGSAQVVTSGAAFLTDGDLVRVNNNNSSPAKKVSLNKSKPAHTN